MKTPVYAPPFYLVVMGSGCTVGTSLPALAVVTLPPASAGSAVRQAVRPHQQDAHLDQLLLVGCC
jgi:hypothetical protein